MKVKFNVQQNGVNTLKEKFELHSNSELKKTYMVIGSMKDTGFDILEEFLIDLKARKYFMVGIDKKNTTRRILEELCRYTKNVYVYNNNYEDELDASVYVFEYTEKAIVYVTSGSLSLASFSTDLACYVEVIFDFDKSQDEIEYKQFISAIVKESKNEAFVQIDKLYIDKLVDDKEIFSTKQYIHNLPSISELLQKNSNNSSEEFDDVSGGAHVGMPKVDFDALECLDDIDVDISSKIEDNIDDEEVDEREDVIDEKSEEVSEDILEEIKDVAKSEEERYEISADVIDMESMLFEKADIKLVKNTKKNSKDTDETKSRKVDLEKVSNLFLELPAKNLKNTGNLKVPNYIKDLIENFFEGLNKEKFMKSATGSLQRKQNITVEIIDVNNDMKYKENNASITEVQNKTYVSFDIDKLKDIQYEEKDIARIIKLSCNTYHLEIIPKTTEEYVIWKKLCTTAMRGTDRCYGVM